MTVITDLKLLILSFVIETLLSSHAEANLPALLSVKHLKFKVDCKSLIPQYDISNHSRYWCWRWSTIKCHPMSVAYHQQLIIAGLWIATFFWQRFVWHPSTRSWIHGSTCCSERSSCASSALWLTLSPTAPQRIRRGHRQSLMLLTNRTKRVTNLA